MLAGAIPFFFLLETKSGQAALMAYLLTVLLGTVLIDNFRQTDSRWFWRAAIPVALIHVSVVLAIVWAGSFDPRDKQDASRGLRFSRLDTRRRMVAVCSNYRALPNVYTEETVVGLSSAAERANRTNWSQYPHLR